MTHARRLCVVAALLIASVLPAFAATPLELAIQARDACALVKANTTATNKQQILSCQSLTAQVVTALTPCAYTVSPLTVSATTAGGTAPVTVSTTAACTWSASEVATWLSASPTSGTGSGTVTLTVATNTSTSVRTDVVTVAGKVVTVTQAAAPPPPPAVAYGPQTGVLCPAGSVWVDVNASIQSAVTTYPIGTAFCLAAGVHPIAGPITPKSSQSFTGEYGAILDGTGWVTSDNTQGAFRASNQDIDDVLISNITIRNMPQKAIQSFNGSDRWILEYIEVGATRLGIELGNGWLRHAFVHDNTVGALTAYQAVGPVVEDSEFTRNGNETKFVGTTNVIFRRNFVHHNINGFWADSFNIGALVENNVVEDNTGNGIEFEISGRNVAGVNGTNTVRNNTVRRSTGGACIFVSTSANTQVYGNTCEDNFRGIQYFLNTAAIQWLASPRTQDLRDNNVHDNIVRVGPQSGSWANALSYSTTTLDMTPYLNGSMNNLFVNNTYKVPNLTTPYWRWGTNTSKTFTDWQLLGHDTTGTVQVVP